jgi:hypothetical protein
MNVRRAHSVDQLEAPAEQRVSEDAREAEAAAHVSALGPTGGRPALTARAVKAFQRRAGNAQVTAYLTGGGDDGEGQGVGRRRSGDLPAVSVARVETLERPASSSEHELVEDQLRAAVKKRREAANGGERAEGAGPGQGAENGAGAAERSSAADAAGPLAREAGAAAAQTPPAPPPPAAAVESASANGTGAGGGGASAEAVAAGGAGTATPGSAPAPAPEASTSAAAASVAPAAPAPAADVLIGESSGVGAPDAAAGAVPASAPFEPGGTLPEVELPTVAATPHQQIALDRISATLGAAQTGLAGVLEAEIGRIQTVVTEQQAAVDGSLATESTRVQERFAQARKQVTADAARETASLAATAEAQGTRLGAWHERARVSAEQQLKARRQRAIDDGKRHAADAGRTADDAAGQATTEAQRQADEARGKAQAKSPSGGEAAVREAKAVAARELAEETATQIGAGGADAGRQLRSQGAEVASGLEQQATQVAEGLGSHLTGLTTHLGGQVATATQTHAAALSGGKSALAQQRDQVLTGLATGERQAVANLERDAAARRAAIASLGAQAASQLRARAEEVSREGGEAVAQAARALATEPVDPPTADAAANDTAAQIGPAYEALGTELRGVGSQAAQGLTETAAGATESLKTAADQIDQRVAGNEREAGDSAQQAGDGARTQLVGVTDGTTSAGDSAVDSFTGVLDQHLDGADRAASTLQSNFAGSVESQLGKVGGDLAQPAASLDARIDTAQARAAERAERSWISNQLHDLWDTVSSPEFLVGLLVGLAVGAIIILSAGTATPFVIMAAAVAGGAAAGAASTMTGNVRNGKGLFDDVLHNTIVGAAAGGIGAAVFLFGGGVVAGLGLSTAGAAVGGFVVLEVSAIAANTVTNLVNGDPWDKNLLTAMLLAPLVKFVGERIPGMRGRPPVEEPDPNVKPPGATETPDPARATPKPRPDVAILPDGTPVPPTSYRGGYHGTDTPPSVALSEGFPGRGTDLSLHGHAEAKGNSAFRGTTEFPSGPNPDAPSGAAYWAGEGGWVYEIRNVPTWDVNALLEGRVKTPEGFRGNLMVGEGESAIPARVTPDKIVRYGQVVESRGRLYVKDWIDARGGGGGQGEQ